MSSETSATFSSGHFNQEVFAQCIHHSFVEEKAWTTAIATCIY